MSKGTTQAIDEIPDNKLEDFGDTPRPLYENRDFQLALQGVSLIL
jgi:hypothetical protein